MAITGNRDGITVRLIEKRPEQGQEGRARARLPVLIDRAGGSVTMSIEEFVALKARLRAELLSLERDLVHGLLH